MLAVVILAALLAAEDPHLAINPLYRQLRGEGMELSAGNRTPLPPPLMADGLDPQQILQVIEAIPQRHVPVDEFLRKSIVAPLAFRFHDLPGGSDDNPIRGIDVFFVAYGEFAVLEDERRVSKAIEEDRRDVHVHVLDSEELAQRKITVAEGEQFKQRYAFCRAELLDRIALSTTLRTLVSRTDESIVFASAVDKRFESDADFPNSWRPLVAGDDGQRRPGESHLYPGAASYVKATRLKEPAGAIFVEYHQAFVEPKGWFGGANLLRSKLPMLIQSEVRTLRRELQRFETEKR